MKRWRFWFGVIISAVFLWLAVRGLRLDEVWVDIKSANYWWLFPSITTYFIAVWVRTWRWDYMLRPLKHIPLRRLFPVVVIGYMGNNIYPLRAGEVLRSYVLRQREEVPMSASLATVVVERVFDGLVMLVFVFVALPFAPLPNEFRLVVALGSILFFAAMIFFFALAAVPQRILVFTDWFSFRFLPGRFRVPVMDAAVRFMAGLDSLRRFRNVLMIFFTSIIIWLLETVKYWFVMQAFDFQVSFFALMLMNGIVNLVTTLPSAPGYIGTFEVGAEVLEKFQVNPDTALAYTVVLHAALWLPITLLGGYYMIREGLGWSDFGRAVTAVETTTVEGDPA